MKYIKLIIFIFLSNFLHAQDPIVDGLGAFGIQRVDGNPNGNFTRTSAKSANKCVDITTGIYYCNDDLDNTWEVCDIDNQIIDADGDTKIQVEKSADEDFIRFDTRGVQRMNIDPDGNIGIGMDNPLEKFHLQSTSALSTRAIWETTANNMLFDLKFPTNEVGAVEFFENNSLGGALTYDGTLNTLRINSTGTTNDSTVMWKNKFTGLGITPTEKLHVDGNIRHSGALMPGNNAGTSGQVLTSAGAGNANTWADYNTNISGTRTAGSIYFQGATGALDWTEDNSNLFWDNTNNRLGIGTAAPSALISFPTQTVGAGQDALSKILRSTTDLRGPGVTQSHTLYNIYASMDNTAAFDHNVLGIVVESKGVPAGRIFDFSTTTDWRMQMNNHGAFGTMRPMPLVALGRGTVSTERSLLGIYYDDGRNDSANGEPLLGLNVDLTPEFNGGLTAPSLLNLIGQKITIDEVNGNGNISTGLEINVNTGTARRALNVTGGAITLAGNAGTAGDVLTSAGLNAVPTWQTVAVQGANNGLQMLSNNVELGSGTNAASGTNADLTSDRFIPMNGNDVSFVGTTNGTTNPVAVLRDNGDVVFGNTTVAANITTPSLNYDYSDQSLIFKTGTSLNGIRSTTTNSIVFADDMSWSGSTNSFISARVNLRGSGGINNVLLGNSIRDQGSRNLMFYGSNASVPAMTTFNNNILNLGQVINRNTGYTNWSNNIITHPSTIIGEGSVRYNILSSDPSQFQELSNVSGLVGHISSYDQTHVTGDLLGSVTNSSKGLLIFDSNSENGSIDNTTYFLSVSEGKQELNDADFSFNWGSHIINNSKRSFLINLNSPNVSIVAQDTMWQNNDANSFKVRADLFEFHTANLTNKGTVATQGVSLTAASWNSFSDSTMKTNFRYVDGDKLLDYVSKVEPQEWSYKADKSKKYVGYTAQQFHNSPLGVLGEEKNKDQMVIETVAGIGYNSTVNHFQQKRIEALEEENKSLTNELENLRSEVAQIKAMLNLKPEKINE